MNTSHDFSKIAEKYGFSGVTYETGNYTKQGFLPSSDNYSGLRIGFTKPVTLKDGETTSSESSYQIDGQEAAAIADRIQHWSVGKHLTQDASEMAAIAECITQAGDWKSLGLNQPNMDQLKPKTAVDKVIDQVAPIQDELSNQTGVLSKYAAKQIHRELSEHLDNIQSAENPADIQNHLHKMTESLGKILEYGLPLFHGKKEVTIEHLKNISDAVVTTGAQVANNLEDGIVSHMTGHQSVHQENRNLQMP